MVEAGNDHFVIYGVARVTKVGIFRNVNGGSFHLYRKVKVNKNNGKFRTRVFQYKHLRTCFRVLAPATATTSQHIVPVGCIVTVHGKQVWQPASRTTAPHPLGGAGPLTCVRGRLRRPSRCRRRR